MENRSRWARILMIAGLLVMIMSAVDPLEGSLGVAPGIGLAMVGAVLGQSRQRGLLRVALIVTVAGVVALWALSAMGGVGGDTGRSMWWMLVVLPYPAGWLLGIVGAIRGIRELFRSPARTTS